MTLILVQRPDLAATAGATGRVSGNECPSVAFIPSVVALEYM